MASTAPSDLDVARLKEELISVYKRVANEPSSDFHFHRGSAYAVGSLGYDPDVLASLPSETVASFAGMGNPHDIGSIERGETVLDIGCGSGTDLLIAAKKVGPQGKAIGVDITEAMRARASAGARTLALDHVEVLEGDALELPVEDESIDVVISNGVLNLTPNKVKAFREIARVLKPGGRLQFADIVVKEELSEDIRNDIDLWTGWIAGALPEAELIRLLEGIGLEQVRITHRFDCFGASSKEEIAREFRVHAVNLFAQKPRKAKRAVGNLINRLRMALKRSSLVSNGKVEIGRPAPDFIVPAQQGPGEFRLSSERGHFVLLFFIPSAWCPVCHVNLRIYRQRASELAERNVKLAVVSMSSGPEAEAFAKEIGLDYVVLRDEEWRIARQYGAVSSSRAATEDIALPASFLIDPEGIVRYASRPYDVTDLAEAKVFTEVLEAV